MTVRSATRTLALAAAALCALGTAAACGDDAPTGDPNRVDVVTGFYPLRFVAEQVGGDAVGVRSLAKPGAEPHDLELNPAQVGEVSRAELIVYLAGFQPAVDEAVAQNGGNRAFDVAGVQPLLATDAGAHQHEGAAHNTEQAGHDPHVWLDPSRLATIGDRLAERLGRIDPKHAADFTARARTLRSELETLDREYEQGLATCQRREIVVSHSAFGYLAQRYRLEQVALTGLSPDSEPSPQRLAAVIEEAKAHRATTIFFEPLVSPKVAETIAHAAGARTTVLDPVEGPPTDTAGDYLSVMRENLAALRPALGCS